METVQNVFSRILIFGFENTPKYSVLGPSKKYPYSVCPNYAFQERVMSYNGLII